LSTTTYTPEFEKATYAKVSWRLIPFLFLCYILAYLDRVNVGFAKLQMATDLSFSDTVYGAGAGIFFIGYFFFEVPSNIILSRVGAKIWIARIMILWGIVAMAFMFLKGTTMFYAMRFLLRGRSWILSRSDSLSDVLVSRQRTGAHNCAVCHRRRDGGRSRLADFRRDSRTQWCGRTRRLAVAFFPGSTSSCAHGPGGVVRST
jgi:hypothetical protein